MTQSLDQLVDAAEGFMHAGFDWFAGTLSPVRGLGRAEARIMGHIGRLPGSSSGEVADRLGMDRGQLSRAVDTLQAEGLLDRRISRHDGRVRTLWLSARGSAAAAELAEAQRAALRARLLAVPAKRHRDLTKALQTLEVVTNPEDAVYPTILRPMDVREVGAVLGQVHDEVLHASEGKERDLANQARQLAECLEGRGQCVVAEVNGAVVGAASWRPAGTDGAVLDFLYVVAPLRERGVGSALLANAVSAAREAGEGALSTEIPATADAAVQMLEQAGFVAQSGGLRRIFRLRF